MTTPTPKPKPPYRSTTTPEKFFHARLDPNGVAPPLCYDDRKISHVSAFARPAKDGAWYVSYAECDVRDGFNRQRGRIEARRKWFEGKRQAVASDPSYTAALAPYVVPQS